MAQCRGQGRSAGFWSAELIALAVAVAACSRAGGDPHGSYTDAGHGHGDGGGDGGGVVADAAGCETPDSGAKSCTLPGCPETFATLPAGFDLYGVWIGPEKEVWAVGEGGFVGRRAPSSGDWCWCAPSPSGTLRSVWGASSNDVFAVGDGATLLRLDGTRWLSYSAGGPSYSLRGVHGTSPENVWAVGTQGIAWHFNGSSWEVDGVETKYDLNAVWVDPTGVARAAGHAPIPETIPGASDTAEAVILRHAPDPGVSGWTIEASFPVRGIAAFQGISGTTPTNIWAVGVHTERGAAEGFGFAARFDGSAWIRVPDPMDLYAGRFFTDVAVGAPDEGAVWLTAGADSGLRYDGSSFMAADVLAGMNAIDTDGSAMYAVGADGEVLRWTTASGWVVDLAARPPFAIPAP